VLSMSRPQDTPLLAHKRSCLSQITIHLVGCDVLLRSSPREEVTTVNIRLCRTLTHMTGMQEQVGYKVRAATGNNFFPTPQCQEGRFWAQLLSQLYTRVLYNWSG